MEAERNMNQANRNFQKEKNIKEKQSGKTEIIGKPDSYTSAEDVDYEEVDE